MNPLFIAMRFFGSMAWGLMVRGSKFWGSTFGGARSWGLAASVLYLAALLAGPCGVRANAAELRQKTAEAFDHYAKVTEARIAGELNDPNAFLWVDRQPEPRRRALSAELHQGKIVVEPLETHEPGDPQGKPIPIPDGLVHHWIATAFIPGGTLRQTLAILQDYNRHQEIYKPDVQLSKLLKTDGKDFKVYFRLRRKAIVTVFYNAEFDIRYVPVGPKREYSSSYATRIAEVDDPDKPNEHEQPVGKDHGYLWRLNTYWRYEERDGGVYVQLEFVALSRSVPAVFTWIVNPYLRSIPQEYLTNLLLVTSQAVRKK
ncbi:MAG TPA: hypothetical protein VKZ53_06955 [Candidatus Angelobacter sp.]|nr:hypothetical protein [Candidatus Angelobacter sp.]